MSGTPLREKSLGVRSGCSGKRRLGGRYIGWEKEREERREEWLYGEGGMVVWRGRNGCMEREEWLHERGRNGCMREGGGAEVKQGMERE